MKAATVVAVALAAFSSFPSPAQQDVSQNQSTALTVEQIAPSQTLAMLQEPSTTPTQPQTAAPSQAQPDQQQQPQANVKTVQLQLITGELVDRLDSKSAKQGDSVVLKTKEEVKTPDGTDIPKGSKLVGRVTNVQARGGGAENSQITLQFDRAELKTGQTLPIASVIESVAPSAGEKTTENGNSMTPASPEAPGMPSNGSSPAGTVPGNATGSPSYSSGANQNAMNQPGMASPAGQAAAQSTQSNGSPAAGSIVARNGNVAIRTTSIPGVLIANNLNGQPFSNASGMLLGARRDINLDGGTQMVVGVATTPIAPGSGMSR